MYSCKKSLNKWRDIFGKEKSYSKCYWGNGKDFPPLESLQEKGGFRSFGIENFALQLECE